MATKEFGAVTPTLSILAEPSVTVVDKVVNKRGTRKVAEAYLSYLYSDEGQDIAGKHYYRPRDPKAAEKYKAQFSPVKLFTIDEVFGGWAKAQDVHFQGRRPVRPDLRRQELTKSPCRRDWPPPLHSPQVDGQPPPVCLPGLADVTGPSGSAPMEDVRAATPAAETYP